MNDRKIQGIFFRDIDNSYISEILKEMYRDRVYDPYLSGKKDLVIMDIGANIGLFSFYAYDKAKIIYALEPSQSHFEEMITMFAFNDMQQVSPQQVALSNKNGTQTFYHNQNSTMYSLKSEVNDGSESETVETVTLDEFFKRNKIKHVDFMKLDVEGAEGLIVNSDGFAKVADKIDVIVGEYHTWSGTSPKGLEDAFVDLGFKFKWLNKTEASLFEARRL